MPEDQSFDQCLQAFINRDYAGCAQRAMPMLATGVRHELLQLLLISLQRLGQTEIVERLAPQVLAATQGQPWIHSLLQLTLGEMEPSQVLRKAKTEEQVCQVLYYSGARSLTAGQEEYAEKMFTLCRERNANCLEHRLAKYELRPSSSSVDDESTSSPERTVETLNRKVFQLVQEGQLQEALTLAREVFQLAQKHLGPDHLEITTSLHNLGSLLLVKHDLAEARPYLERALDIRQRVLGPDHPEIAYTLDSLGGLLDSMGDPAGARPYYERALNIRLKVLGAAHPDTASSLSNLGSLLQVMGELSEARPYLERALSIREKVLGPDHPDTATNLNNLGSLLQDMGELFGARPYFERALSIREKVLGPDHPDTARSLSILSGLLLTMGELSGARPYYERALSICEKVHGPEHPDTAGSLSNLGSLLFTMGELSGARLYFERALSIYEKVQGPEHPDTAGSLTNLGGLLLATGDLSGARPFFERALSIFKKVHGPEHPDTARSLNTVGGLLLTAGDLSGARPFFERALSIREKVAGPEHPDTARSLFSLGFLLQAMGELSGVRPYYERALSIREKVLGPEHPDTATILKSLAHLCVARDQEAEALPWMQQAAAIDDRMIGQVFSIGSERERAAFLKKIEGTLDVFLSLVSRHLEETHNAVRAALDLVLRRKAITAEALTTQRDAVLGGKYPALQASLRQLADLRQQIARKTLAGPGPEGLLAHQQQLAQWTGQKETLETQLARQIPEMNLGKKLQQADRRAVALGLNEGVSLVEFVRFDVFDFKAVPARGERRWQPARYLAFVLLAGQPDNVQMIDLGEAEPIDRLIADFRSSITGEAEIRSGRNMVKQRPEQAAAFRTKTGTQLRAAVFDSLIPALGGCRQLLLAPDGALTRLPFEVLPSADGRLLINDYQISYLGAGRDVLRFGAETTGQPTDSLVVADPDFDLDTETAARRAASAQPKMGFWSRLFGRQPPAPPPLPASTTVAEAPGRRSRDLDRGKYHFDRLPGTRGEGQRIAALLGVQPWLEHTALEGRLKQKCCSPRILHLATHGFFLQDQPHDPNQEGRDLGVIGGSLGGPGRLSGPLPENPLLRSGLALAGANTWLQEKPMPPEAEDGLLTAEDVSGLDLLATELVVLSACETGLGEVKTGEGVFGLQRAFVLAGAKTLVMSLWSVPDEPTRELMEDFYRRILSGEPRADALRAAQMTLRAKYPDPFYWGAFICQGNPGPLPQPTP